MRKSAFSSGFLDSVLVAIPALVDFVQLVEDFLHAEVELGADFGAGFELEVDLG